MIRKVLVPIRGDGKGENTLAHAAVLAHRFDAHVEAVHSRPGPEDMIPFGIPIPGILRDEIIKSSAEVANAEERRLRADFDQWVRNLNLAPQELPLGTLQGERATVSWREAQGKQVDVIKTHGRLADLIVVAKPDRDRNLGANTLKSALFHTGRPVLMCPMVKSAPATIGARITVAWNGSTEVARAVALTADLIQAADDVIILSGQVEIHGASADELLRYLALRGVRARVERLPDARRIMGAYRNSHEHETMFGGNTQAVVDEAAMPVVLVH